MTSYQHLDYNMAITWDKKNETNKLPQVPEERGFSGELVPAAFATGGAILGGMAGSVVPGAGTAAGAVAGAGVGGALGETIQQGIEKRYGQREDISGGQIVASGAINAGLQVAGGVFTKYAKPVFNAAKPQVVKLISKVSGYADDVLEKALQRTPGAVEGVRQGETALKDIVVKTATGVNKYAKDLVSETKTKVAEFSKKSVSGALPGTKQNLLNDSKNYVSGVVSSLRNDFNIGVDKTGQLIFDRAKNISNIVSGGDRQAIQDAFTAIQKVSQNPDIRNIDSVLERLITLRTKTPVGSPTGAETRAVIARMSDSVIDFLKSVPAGYGKGYSEYVKFLETNLPKRILINDAKELFGGSANLSPKEISQIEKRLLQIYNTGNLPQREFAEEVGKTIGEDITGTAAGTLVSTGDQMSVRAPNLTVRGVAQKVAEFLPRKIVQNYIETGTITGELATISKTLAKVLDVSEDVILRAIGNTMTNKKEE